MSAGSFHGDYPIALLVEDDEDCRTMYQRVLEARGYHVIARDRAENLIELAASEKPSVLLVDISLPGLSGIEACERLKQDPRTSMIPVIMLTGHDSFESIRLSTNAGADAYLLKPVKPTKVMQVIARLLGVPEPALEQAAS